MKVNFEAIPGELRALQNWTVWKAPDTKPLNARTGGNAQVNNPKTWSDFETVRCVDGEYHGVGLVVAPPYVGFDIDDCFDPESAKLLPWVDYIVRELNSYTEVSPSGEGLRIFVKAELPNGNHQFTVAPRGGIEVYGRGKCFRVTGDLLDGAPHEIREIPQADLKAVLKRCAVLAGSGRKRGQRVPVEIPVDAAGEVEREAERGGGVTAE